MTKLFNDETEVETIVIPTDDPLAPFKTKYTDEAGIAKALVAKDDHIKRLERENAEARVELAARTNVEEVVDRLLKAKDANPPNNLENTNNSGQPNGTPPTSTGLTAAEVEKMLAERDQQSKAKSNQDFIVKELTNRYGPDYTRVVAQKAKEMGESMEFFEALAQTRPNVLLSLLPAATQQQKDQVFTPSSSAVNTTGTTLGLHSSTERTQRYYQDLKKKMPIAEYLSPKIQNQMYQDSMKLGEKFFDV